MTTLDKLRQLLRQSVGYVAPANHPFSLTVQRTEQLTSNLQRITLGGKAVSRFPKISAGSYIKLMFDANGQALTELPKDGSRPLMRTYTIRQLDKKMKMLTLDMVLHDDGDSGPAARWAAKVKVGESILVRGPGSIKPLPGQYDWLLFAGDMTALPAIACHLESLPANSRGYAIVQVPDLGDVVPLKKPRNIKVQWVTGDPAALVERVSELKWLPGRPAVWAACEFSVMRKLRQEFRVRRNVQHQQLYISSYWRQGRSEDQHKEDKKRDQQAFSASPSV